MTEQSDIKIYAFDDKWPAEGNFTVLLSNGTASYRRGTGSWYIDGIAVTQLHRTDGPAFIWEDGEMEWWVYGKKFYSYAQYQEASGCSDSEIIILKLKYGEIG